VKLSEMLEVGLRMLAFKARHDALEVLTPEQRAKGTVGHENSMRGMHEMPGMHQMMGGQHGGSPRVGH
jgi:Spy/CpxP family protein refolding chaperone